MVVLITDNVCPVTFDVDLPFQILSTCQFRR